MMGALDQQTRSIGSKRPYTIRLVSSTRSYFAEEAVVRKRVISVMPAVLSDDAVVRRHCDCDLCTTDRKTEEFFTKKRYWWSR